MGRCELAKLRANIFIDNLEKNTVIFGEKMQLRTLAVCQVAFLPTGGSMFYI
jgi:hypothetical protein